MNTQSSIFAKNMISGLRVLSFLSKTQYMKPTRTTQHVFKIFYYINDYSKSHPNAILREIII